MGFKMPPIPTLIGIVCAGVGLLFQIVGVATTGWIVVDIGSISVGIGLFQQCSDSTCVDLTDVDWLQACQAFGIIGVLLLVGCLVVGILICFIENDKFPLIAAILGLAAGLCILIEFAVYAGESALDDYGYSFALTIVACLLAVAAGVCFFLGKGKA